MRPLLYTLVALIVFSTSTLALDWQVEEILDHQGIGSDCDLVVDAAGALHLSFEYKHGSLASSAVNYGLKPDDGSPWQITTVGFDYNGYTGYDNEIALDADGHPRLSYVWDIDWDYVPFLKHAWFDGVSWHSQQLTDYSESIEYPTTIGIDADDYSHLLYGDWYGAGPLHHRWENAEGWQHEVVDTGNCRSPHLVIGEDDTLHVIYFSTSSGQLKYGHNDGSGWVLSTVEVDGGIWALCGMDMVLDPTGKPHAVYRGSNREQRHAWFDGATWQVEVIHDDALGYPSIAIDDLGGIHICYSTYTAGSNRPLTYSSKPPGGAWATEFVTSSVQCWNTAMEIDPAGRPHIVFYNYSGGITTHAWAGDLTGVAETDPERGLRLSPAWPNPSGGDARFAFELPSAAGVELELFDVSGRRVETLRRSDFAAGRHVVELRGLPGGVYLARLKAGGETRTRKLVVLSESFRDGP
jgi:hypothetical protein